MPFEFNIALTGYVGDTGFNRERVRSVLERNAGRPVTVLIESYGGDLATGLSIASAFSAHGNVTVVLRGMNASAATVASLGARRVVIESNAMYMIHRVSTTLIDWSQLNAEGIQARIEELQSLKETLENMDLNIASMYAAKSGRPIEDIQALMERELWITAEEAKERGLVDEVHQVVKALQLTNSVAAEMMAAGTPLPNIPVTDDTSAIGRFIKFLENIFRKSTINPTTTENMETLQNAAPEQNAAPVENAAPAPAQPAETPAAENAADTELETLRAENSRLQEENARLRAAASFRPAAGTSTVIENHTGAAEPTDVEEWTPCFANSVKGARELHDQLRGICG